MRWVVVFLLSGCSSILGIDDFKLGDAGPTGDGPDAMEMGFCLGPTGYRICVPTEPTNVTDFNTDGNIDTKNSPLCLGLQPPSWKAAGQPDACIIVGKQITFSAQNLTFNGERPLVIFASDTITVSSRLDVASHLVGASGQTRGAGLASTLCGVPGAPTPAANNQSAGGGGGGSFITKGGDGGRPTSALPAGTAAAADVQAPTILRTGCDGGRGGNTQTSQGGLPGMGGGAVYLVAKNRIVVNGFINASGSAGLGGGPLAGGGGGGTGGMIVLHAAMFSGSGGVALANGGGGGKGGDSNQGLNGTDPNPALPSNPALGGQGGGAGGNGGNGFAGTVMASTGSNGAAGANGGGGGGGGASGYIRANLSLTNIITTSPDAKVIP